MQKFERKEVLQKLREFEKKISELMERNKSLERDMENLITTQPKIENILKVIQQSKSKSYWSYLTKRLRDMEEGTISLTANDYFQFWTDLHIKDEIYFSKVTSRILPVYWDEPEMQLYERRQFDSIRRFKHSEIETKLEYKIIKEKISLLLEQLKEQYKGIGISNGVVKERFKDFFEENFERIFILDPKSPHEEVERLAKIIKRQLDGGVTVRVICVTMNETSTFERPQDFGLTGTSTGDLFGMFCDVDIKGNPQGGVIIRSEDKIRHYLDCYLKIRGRSIELRRNYSQKEISAILHNLIQCPIDISDSELYGNRCYKCLKQAENMINSGKWEYEESPLQTWYEIVRDEQEAISNILPKLQPNPRVILELGCGPGRVINLILKLVSMGKIVQPSRIIGYDQNSEIAGLCTDAFTNHPNVTIYSHFVGFKRDNTFSSVRAMDRKSFDLIIAVSNLVGWQEDNEVKWLTKVIEDGLKVGGRLFCTVYKKGNELERARMYKASGDIIYLDTDIVLVTDAFKGEKHRTKAYKKEDIENILENVSKAVNIKYEIDSIGNYMWSILIEKVS